MWGGVYDFSHGWTAAAYISNFFIYLATSVMELIAWIFYLAGDNVWLGWYAMGLGWYGSIFFAFLPVLFAAFQIGFPSERGGLNGDEDAEFGKNASFLVGVGFAVWF